MRLDKPAKNCFLIGLTAVLAGGLVTGCAPYATTFVWERPASQRCDEDLSPRKIGVGDDLAVWAHGGRLYVFGSSEAGRRFQENPMMSDGLVEPGAGPAGEEVVFENDPGNPESVKELQQRYHQTPKLLWRVGRNHSVWKLGGRIYVLGPDPVVERDFLLTRELVVSKTFFGLGPRGETVVVEASKSRNQYADLLLESFLARPVLIDSRCPDYFVWKKQGRILVVGSPASSSVIESGGDPASTRALLGAGPEGETVAFEADWRRPQLFERLVKAYFGEGAVPAGLL